MKTCINCGQTFCEDHEIPKNPAEILGDLFLRSVSPVDDSDLCPACRKELGMLNLMGFGK